MSKLTVTAVRAAKSAGRYGDGAGLYLLVSKSGAKSWMVRVQKDGRRRDIGLGSVAKVSLADARRRAEQARTQVEAGIDPVAVRKKAAGIPTFREAAATVFSESKQSWRNAKHKAQWLSSLEAYSFAAIGNVPVSQVDNAMVRDLLVAIWLTKPETARRVRQRVSTVIDWAVGKGYRDAPLTMSVINKALPKQKRRDNHHAALPFVELPVFMIQLKERESVGRLAMNFLILTAARSGEVRGATWSEIDLEARIWTLPAGRMKSSREHVVPLSTPAIEILRRMQGFRHSDSDLVFPSQRGKPLSDMTLTKVLRDMALTATPHGFRSSFKDWAAELTSFPNELSEAALAHSIADKVEAAYRRGNLLDKRRVLMGAWADYCEGRDSKVIRLATN
ncbi:MAG: tyrosine-type recombinase/integrase [Sphingorhabdus sp.]|uniref:tyrosine-type recombinase/integrase n=1 Tax=Sphingorhabdus sp. TaxID=1902408 RepID=UPI0038FC2391